MTSHVENHLEGGTSNRFIINLYVLFIIPNALSTHILVEN